MRYLSIIICAVLVLFSLHQAQANAIRAYSDSPTIESGIDDAVNEEGVFKDACGTNCLKPFCPPDRWYDANGDGFWNPDSGDYYDPVTTGYMAPEDIGAELSLYLNNAGNSWRLGWYYAVRFPGYSGASDYRNWIADCVDYSLIIHTGDKLELEPASMVGPTKQGLSDLMSQDPGAHWDEAADTVAGSCCEISPRVIKVPAFDPVLGVESAGGPGWVTIAKIMVVFVEGYDASANIVVRFMGTLAQNCGDANRDGVVNIADVLYLANYFFQDGPTPLPLVEAGDADCDGAVNVADITYLVNYLFIGGPPPCGP